MFCVNASTMATVGCDTPDALIVVSKDELIHMSPFYLDPESAVVISGAILMLWAVAFVLRMARKSVESSNESESI
jgi:hypothetical protein